MAFPSLPVNGQTYTTGGVTYVYNSTKGVWAIQTYDTVDAAGALTSIKTVDGAGSGLDADTLDGYTSGDFWRKAESINADTLDGIDSSQFLRSDVKTIGTNIQLNSNAGLDFDTASLVLYDTSDAAADNGGSIVFSHKWNNSGYLGNAPYIKGYKLNASTSDYSTGLKFATRQNGVGSAAVGLTIDPFQNVGMGTTVPSRRLHVNSGGTNVAALFESSDSEVWIDLQDSASGTYGCLIGHDANNLVKIADANVTERFKISPAGHVTMPYQPAFDAYRTSGGYGVVDPVPFQATTLNVGGHFSLSTNRFTAPVAGTYWFYTSQIKNNDTGTVARREFMVNGAQFAGGRHLRLDTGQPYGDNGTFAHLIYLNAGDYVNVRLRAGTSYGNDDYDYFGGFLVG